MSASTPLQTWPYPRWIAHRGAGKLAPENTLAAFRLGASLGYRAFECDVKLSADGQLFLLHDATLARTLRGDLAGDCVASSLDWATLSRLDAGLWHSAAYAGEPPASLDAVAAFCMANNFALNLEIKPTPGQEATTGQAVASAVQRLWARARLADRSPWPLLSSFQPIALEAAAQQAIEVPRALLLDTLRTDGFAMAQRLGCAAVVLNHALVDDPSLIRGQQADGRRVLAYTVNDPGRAEQLVTWGIDGVITDAVDRISPGDPGEFVGPAYL